MFSYIVLALSFLSLVLGGIGIFTGNDAVVSIAVVIMSVVGFAALVFF